jgi:hypothetical protein
MVQLGELTPYRDSALAVAQHKNSKLSLWKRWKAWRNKCNYNLKFIENMEVRYTKVKAWVEPYYKTTENYVWFTFPTEKEALLKLINKIELGYNREDDFIFLNGVSKYEERTMFNRDMILMFYVYVIPRLKALLESLEES